MAREHAESVETARGAVGLRVAGVPSRMLDVQAIAEARVGRSLRKKWQLDALVGIGGMAAVYRARHRNGALVALKILHPQIAIAEDLRRRFVREGYVANSIDHPAVVRVLDDDVDDDGTPFLVMDFVEGETLAAKVQRGRFREPELLEVGAQLCDALQAAHDAGVVHRDLKPDNLLVDPDGRVRILDFGIARLLEPGARTGSFTKTGMAFGTPGFIAPEQALGHRRRIGPATDLFALGATLFYLATGELLHVAETPEEQLVRVATVPARALAEVAPWIAPEVSEIVDRALRMEIAERWPSASAMLAAIEAVRGARADAPSFRDAETLAPPPPSSRPPSRITTTATLDAAHERPSRASIRPSLARRVRPRRSTVTAVSAAAIAVASLAAFASPRAARSEKPEAPQPALVSLAERALPAIPEIAPEAAAVAIEVPAEKEPPACPSVVPKPPPRKPRPAVAAHDPHKLLDRLFDAHAPKATKK